MKVCAHCLEPQATEGGLVARHGCARGCHRAADPCPGSGHEPMERGSANADGLREIKAEFAWLRYDLARLDASGADPRAVEHVLLALAAVQTAESHLELAALADVRARARRS